MRKTPSSQANERRGVAMLLVLVAVTVATIVAYSVLTNAALDAQVHRGQQGGHQAVASAEDVTAMAIYYLQYPADAPAAEMASDDFGTYWAGRNNIAFGDDGTTIDVDVASLGAGRYRVETTATDADGTARAVTAIGERRFKEWTPDAAIQSNNNTRPPDDTTITGDVWVGGAWSTAAASGASVSGSVYKNGNAPAGASGDPSPALADLALVQAASGDRTYWYNGALCTADVLDGSEVKEMPAASAANAGGVFVYTGTGTLKFHMHDDGSIPVESDLYDDGSDARHANAVFSGTLVVPNGAIEFKHGMHVIPEAGMPAIIVGGDLTYEDDMPLQVQGLVFLGSDLVGSDANADLRIVGALLHAGTSSTLRGTNWAGSIQLTYDADLATVQQLLADDATTFEIESWTLE